jgi:phenylalanyl-tRNA synthetase beta chain
MKITLNWLKEYVDHGMPREALLARLSEVGLPIEDTKPIGDDTYVDVEITSNRPDCLSLIGIAREVSAFSGRPLKTPKADYRTSAEKVASVTSVETKDLQLCPRYIARVIRGVKVAPSPAWLQARLEAIGLRPVNNVVDITNFVLMECGQPLHAFDFDRLREKRIIVRRAKPGETITAIDQKKYELKDDMLVIADAARAVAVAGVMGGFDTEVGNSTKNILLESAYFEPASIRRASKALKLSSDSSFRFERGVDWDTVDWASRRAAAMMAEIAGGEILDGVIDVQGAKPPVVRTALRFQRLPFILGVDVPKDEAVRILTALNFKILNRAAEKVEVEVPPYRHDIEREIDLIEEVARHYGYNKFDVEKPMSIAVTRPTKEHEIEESVREILVGNGCSEVATVPFVGDSPAGRACVWEAGEPLAIRNPMNKELGFLRRSLLPCFMQVKRHNESHGVPAISIFEMSRVFLPRCGTAAPGCESSGGNISTPEGGRATSALPEEKQVVGVLTDGDFLDLKGILEAVFTALKTWDRVVFAPLESNLFEHGATMSCDGVVLGHAGVVSEKILAEFDLRGKPAYAEIDFALLVKFAADIVRYRQLPRFPSVERDICVVLNADIPWDKVEASVAWSGIQILDNVELVDVYSGKQLPKGKKSFAFRVTYRSDDGTLTSEQVAEAQDFLINRLKESFGAELRQ